MIKKWQMDDDELEKFKEQKKKAGREYICENFKVKFTLIDDKPHWDFFPDPLLRDPNDYNKSWDGSTLDPRKVHLYFIAAAQEIRKDLARDPVPSEIAIAQKVLEGYSNASNHAANGIGHLLVEFEKEQDVNKLLSGLQELRERAMKTAYFMDNGFDTWLKKPKDDCSPWDIPCYEFNIESSNNDLAAELAESDTLAEQVADCVENAYDKVAHPRAPSYSYLF